MRRYYPRHSFEAYQRPSPAAPLRGDRLDIELREISEAINALSVHYAQRGDIWRQVSQNPVLIEAAGNLGTAAFLVGPDDVRSEAYDHRLGVFQGTPPGGPFSTPSSIDYGNGAQPTYVRFEMRDGAAPSSALVGPAYDNYPGDTSYSYPDNPRARIERSFTNAESGFTGADHPNPNTTYFYELTFFIPRTFPLAHLKNLQTATGMPRFNVAQLPIMIVNDDGTPGSGEAYPAIISILQPGQPGPHAEFFLLRDRTQAQRTIALGSDDDFLGKWNTVRVETEFSESASGRLLLNGSEVTNWSGELTLRSTDTLQMLAFRYGAYGYDFVMPNGRQDLYIPGERETYVLYTELKFGTV